MITRDGVEETRIIDIFDFYKSFESWKLTYKEIEVLEQIDDNYIRVRFKKFEKVVEY